MSTCRQCFSNILLMAEHNRAQREVLVIFSAVMVTGGNGPAGSKSVELLSSNGTWLCFLSNLPDHRDHHTQTGLITCGGGVLYRGKSERTSCVTFSAGRWKKTHTLGQKRWAHTAWASPQGVLLMGGHDIGTSTTTELLTDNGDTTPSFNLGNSRV